MSNNNNFKPKNCPAITKKTLQPDSIHIEKRWTGRETEDLACCISDLNPAPCCPPKSGAERKGLRWQGRESSYWWSPAWGKRTAGVTGQPCKMSKRNPQAWDLRITMQNLRRNGGNYQGLYPPELRAGLGTGAESHRGVGHVASWGGSGMDW